MAASSWAVYRRTPDSLERVATATGNFFGNAMDAACRIPSGPRNPIVARAHTSTNDPVDLSLTPAPMHRSRRFQL